MDVNVPTVENTNTNASFQGSDGRQTRNQTADGGARREGGNDQSHASLPPSQGNVIKESAFEYIDSEKSKNNHDIILASSDASTTYQRERLKKKQRLFSHSNAKSYTHYLDNEFSKGVKVKKNAKLFSRYNQQGAIDNPTTIPLTNDILNLQGFSGQLSYDRLPMQRR